ncbi:ABC transporter ATP-binding protein [Parasalinivibrio latis]|uniref:ABC transporter ATP-binding protein n=1 Tax=Parasalinivibrio latis TaxID=2952610 RepID=UPI0030E2B593
MSEIRIRRAEKYFNDVQVINDLNLTIPDGCFFSLLGASGCGKTTTLRAIAGLETFTSGNIFIGDCQADRLKPAERDIAFVFQLYSLYPHLSVADNISFPLRAVGLNKSEIRTRVADVSTLLGINSLLEKKPSALSGGDMQRVAIARALVREPKALLMDEPIGALDATLREQLRGELKALHLKRRTTTVYVTHDQVEAMGMSDLIAVMHNGRLQQVGTPEDIYLRPANTYVAQFVGAPAMNIIPANLVTQDGKTCFLPEGSDTSLPLPLDLHSQCTEIKSSVAVGIRPEHIQRSEKGIPAKVTAVENHGPHKVLATDIGNHRLYLRETSPDVKPGDWVNLSFDPNYLRLFDTDSGLSLQPAA